eukprot:COSAG06_NODE_3203_length_5690_cov_1.769272_7_plen_169_part_00
MFIYMYTVLRGQVKTMMLAQQRKESPLNLLPAELIYQVTSSKAPSHTAAHAAQIRKCCRFVLAIAAPRLREYHTAVWCDAARCVVYCRLEQVMEKCEWDSFGMGGATSSSEEEEEDEGPGSMMRRMMGGGARGGGGRRGVRCALLPPLSIRITPSDPSQEETHRRYFS